MAEKPPAAKNRSPAEPSLDVNSMSNNDIRKELKQQDTRHFCGG
jgi:hypothetical protein